MTSSTSTGRNIAATTLPNGLPVITETMSHVRSVAVGVWIGSGSRRETPEQNGISHFLEHMVFQGTADYTAEDIARDVDSLGGNLDAYTAKEHVCFNTKVLDEHLPKVFDILADLALHPRFREEDVAKEQKVILEEIKMEGDSPEYLVHDLFCRSYWANHSLGRPILGTPETVRTFSSESVRDYHRSVYTPSNIVITAAGNVEHASLLELAEQEFGSLPAAPRQGTPTMPVPRPHIQLKDKDSLEQVQLCLGAPTCKVDDERRYAAYLLNAILGGGMSSRLFQNIREKHGLAYSVYSDLNLYHDTGALMVGAATSVDKIEQLLALTMQEFRQLKNEPIASDELRRAKDQLKGSLMLSLESTSSRMANLARQHLYFGRFFDLDEILESIEVVTLDELQAVARDAFQSDRLALTILGNLNGLEIEPAQLEC
jgi:predicted Zn-dependent peptidase